MKDKEELFVELCYLYMAGLKETFVTFAEARMAEMSSMGIGNKPCLDIRPNADQINDRSISFAQLTRSKWDFPFKFGLMCG